MARRKESYYHRKASGNEVSETPLIIFTLEGAPWRGSLCSARLSGNGAVGHLHGERHREYPLSGKRGTERETFSEKLLSLQAAAPFHVEEDARGNPSRILCSGCNTWTVLSNPFVPGSRLSIFHLTFLSPRISFHHPKPELTTLLILYDGITSILRCL